jgi:hypothetical protein
MLGILEPGVVLQLVLRRAFKSAHLGVNVYRVIKLAARLFLLVYLAKEKPCR